jgi:hypothetical protein
MDILIEGFRHPKQGHYDIDRTIALVPELMQLLESRIDIALQTGTDHGLYHYWVRLIANLEDVVT